MRSDVRVDICEADKLLVFATLRLMVAANCCRAKTAKLLVGAAVLLLM